MAAAAEAGEIVIRQVLHESPLSPLATAHTPIAFLTFPALVWATFRFGPRSATSVMFVLAVAAVAGVVSGAGPWAGANANETLLILLGFMGTASVTTLALGAAVIERERGARALHEVEVRLRVAEERKVAARDEFLSVAAHELRTPLAALKLAAQALVREIDRGGEGGRERLRTLGDVVAERSTRLGELVAHLLDTVRVQSGRMDLLVVSDQDVVSLAERVASETRSRTTRHRIEVRAPTPVTASIDPLRVEQVLRNLLDNAVKYSPGGRIDVDVTREDGQVELRVSDQGPGIVPEHRERIFDRFYQARGSSSDGLGLGLHLSRHLVELHGGTIGAEFPDEGGTRIVVRLPLRSVAAKELVEAG